MKNYKKYYKNKCRYLLSFVSLIGENGMFTCFYRFRFDFTTKNIKSTECDFAMQTA